MYNKTIVKNVISLKRQQDCILIKKFVSKFKLLRGKQLVLVKYLQRRLFLKKMYRSKFFRNSRGRFFRLQRTGQKINFRYRDVFYKKMHKIPLSNKESNLRQLFFQRNCFFLKIGEPVLFEPRNVEIFKRILSKLTKREKKKYKTEPD
jgi:hypothetical protein